MTASFLYLNGALKPSEKASLSIADRGFLLGDGIFETMHAIDGKVLRFEKHMARLDDGCRMFHIDNPFSHEEYATQIAHLLKRNGQKESVVRLTLSRGAGGRGLALPENTAPTCLMTSTACVGENTSPVQLLVSEMFRRNEKSPLSRVKCLSCAENILARQEASARGKDESLLLNSHGRLAEACAANIIVRRPDGWVTPLIEEGAMPGTRRATLLEEGRIHEDRLTLQELIECAGAYLLNALSTRPIVSLTVGEKNYALPSCPF